MNLALPMPGGETSDIRSAEMKFFIAAGVGNICFNFLMGSRTMPGRIRLIEGREKMNLHLNNVGSFQFSFTDPLHLSTNSPTSILLALLRIFSLNKTSTILSISLKLYFVSSFT